MGSLGWKTFGFFDAKIRDEHTGEGLVEGVTAVCRGCLDSARVYKQGGTTASVAGGHTVEKSNIHQCTWVGLSNGLVHCLDEDMEVAVAFPTGHGEHDRIWAMGTYQNVLITVSEQRDSGSTSIMLSCWDISSQHFAVAPPVIVSKNMFQNLKIPDGELTCMSVWADEWPAVHIAVGTSTGAVHVYYAADMVKGGFVSRFGCHVLRSVPENPKRLTDIHFVNHGGALSVFALSEKRLCCLDARSGHVLLEDDAGASKGCSAVSSKGELVICSSDGIFYYTVGDGRTVAAHLKGEKKGILCAEQYVVALIEGEETGMGMIKILDVPKKLIVGNLSIRFPGILLTHHLVDGRVHVMAMEGSGRSICLKEKSMEEQIDTLCGSRAFHIALKLCESIEEKEIISGVYQHYGDYLYDKTDFEAATKMYIKTIGFLETSYVVKKLLEAHRNMDLALYLEALHEKGVASADHTSLLINCYCKMNQEENIRSFVQDVSAKVITPSFKLNIEAAISVLRDSGFTQYALELATLYKDESYYVSILLNECKNYVEAIAFLRTKPRVEAAKVLQEYGHILVKHEPVGTTALLMELCLPPEDDSKGEYVADLADFSHFYSGNPEDLRYACEAILAMGHPRLPSRQSLYHNLLDLYLSGHTSENATCNGEDSKHHMAGHRSNSQKESDLSAALDLLKRGWTAGHEPIYDADVALTTCRLHGFQKGLIFLYMMLREYREAGATMADAEDWDSLLDLCKQYGNDATGGDSRIWFDALTRLSSPAAAGPETEAALQSFLSLVEAHDALPPLVVLPTLAKNPHLHLGLVKQYMIRVIQAEHESIKDDEKSIDSLQAEIHKREELLFHLENEPVTFQATKDSQTGAPLEVPVVHFLCGHSFNMRTLGDTEELECPLCASEHQRIRNMQRSFKAAASDKDAFFRQLRSSEDGFKFVAQSFGKGMMNFTS